MQCRVSCERSNSQLCALIDSGRMCSVGRLSGLLWSLPVVASDVAGVIAVGGATFSREAHPSLSGLGRSGWPSLPLGSSSSALSVPISSTLPRGTADVVAAVVSAAVMMVVGWLLCASELSYGMGCFLGWGCIFDIGWAGLLAPP